MDEMRKQWIEALRSGDYKQGREYLCKDGNYCCLGVACDLFAEIKEPQLNGTVAFDGATTALPFALVELLGLKSPTGIFAETITVMKDGHPRKFGELTTLNDIGRQTFEEIANVLESGVAWRESEKVD